MGIATHYEQDCKQCKKTTIFRVKFPKETIHCTECGTFIKLKDYKPKDYLANDALEYAILIMLQLSKKHIGSEE